MVRQRSATPLSPVRIWVAPPKKDRHPKGCLSFFGVTPPSDCAFVRLRTKTSSQICWAHYTTLQTTKKELRDNSELLEAPTRFELVIEVLQTFALPLGHGAIFNFMSYSLKWLLRESNPCYRRERAMSWPLDQGAITPPVGLEPTTTRLTAECSTDWAKEEYFWRCIPSKSHTRNIF